MTRWRYSGSANPTLARSIKYRPTKEVRLAVTGPWRKHSNSASSGIAPNREVESAKTLGSKTETRLKPFWASTRAQSRPIYSAIHNVTLLHA